MKAKDVTWKEYKLLISEQMDASGGYIYRGQRDSSWALTSSLMRTALIQKDSDFKSYFEHVLPIVQEPVEAWLGREWDLLNNHSMAEFVSYLQHNGFPTPLLDWTYSPYIAAYFAFEEINPFYPQNDMVSIYAFDEKSWADKYTPTYDFTNFKPHVSLLKPRIFGNHKMASQQGCFTWSNVYDIEGHIALNEKVEGEFLSKYSISINERPKAIKELSLMGISAVQIMPSIESVCKKALEDLIGLLPGSNTETKN